MFESVYNTRNHFYFNQNTTSGSAPQLTELPYKAVEYLLTLAPMTLRVALFQMNEENE